MTDKPDYFLVKWDFRKASPKDWHGDYARLFGTSNHGVRVDGISEADAIATFAEDHDLNEFYLTAERQCGHDFNEFNDCRKCGGHLCG